MNDSILKKEFKKSDVERVRNLVNKDFTKGTKQQVGYKKASTGKHEEGDTWEESGRMWTIKNGLKQNVTKLGNAKKALRTPLSCPKCSGPMNNHLAEKMYKIHGFCFNCTIDYEASLRKAGLYEQYEKRFMQGNMKSFIDDLAIIMETEEDSKESFVTEQGDVEDWNSNSKASQAVKASIKEYIELVKEHLD